MAATPTFRRHALPIAAALSLIGAVTPVAAQQSSSLQASARAVTLSASADASAAYVAPGADAPRADVNDRSANAAAAATADTSVTEARAATADAVPETAASRPAGSDQATTAATSSTRASSAAGGSSEATSGGSVNGPAKVNGPAVGSRGGVAARSLVGETCNGLEATIVGTSGPDVLVGTNGDDVIVGLGGDDDIIPGRGNDVTCAGDGNDTVSDSDGNDVIFGGEGDDNLIGGKDDDQLFGEGGNDALNGGSGNDLLDGGDGDDDLQGGRNDDTLFGGAGTNTLNGGQNFDLCDIGEAGTSFGCENFRPVANDVSVAAQEDGPVVTASFDATDDDGDPLTFSILGQPSEGSVANNNDGTFDFDPGADFQDLAVGETRDVTFDYTANDGFQDSAPATVTVTVTGVNDDPVANDDTDATDEDTSIAVDVLSNDTDADTSDVLSVSAVDTTGTTGSVTNNGTDVTYDPSGAFDSLNEGESTSDLFGYTASDGNGGTDDATVTITVNGVNDVPIAQPVAVNAVEDGPTVDGSFDADDADAEDNAATLTYSILGQPSEGSVVDNGDGTFTFDPGTDFQDLAAGATRDVTFDYDATDSRGATSAAATVTVTVTGVDDAPFAGDDDAGTTDEDTPITTASVLGNDGDPDAGETVSVTGPAASSSAAGAAVTNNFDGTFGYDPTAAFQSLAAGETAGDSFTYEVTSTGGGTANGNVSIEVTGVNDAPTADDGGAFGTGTFTITLTGTDPDTSDDLTFSVDPPTLGTLGPVTNSDGTCSPQPCTALGKNSATVEYTAPAGDPEDTFTFTVDDANGGTDTATVVVNLDPGTEPPEDPPAVVIIEAKDDSVEAIEDTPLPITLNAAARAEESTTPIGDLTFSLVSGPPASEGSLSAIVDDAPTPLPPPDPTPAVRSATTTFTPAAGFTGVTSFTFQACEVADPSNCDTATITIDVAAAAPPISPNAPDIRDLNLSVETDQTLNIDLGSSLLGSGVPGCQDPPCQRSSLTAVVRSALATALSGGAQRDALSSISDPSGDSGGGDLLSARVGVTAGINNVAFEIKFDPQTFSSTTTRASVVIDIDRDPNTGFPGVDAANNDSSLMGVEYLINVGANLGANAEIMEFAGGNSFPTVATVPATINSDGFYFNFDLGLLGNDDGFFFYKVTTQTQVSPTPGFTGIQDYMTDLGVFPGNVDPNGSLAVGPVSYTVLSLPQTGSLIDVASGDPITTVPFSVGGANVQFVPDAGTTGTTVNFQFAAENTALQSTVGLVAIALQAPTCEEAESACDDGRP